MNKKNIIVISGGHKWEHNISLRSGYDVSKALIKDNKYNVINILITKEGKLVYSDFDLDTFILNGKNIKLIEINKKVSKEVFQIGNGKLNNIEIFCAFLTTHGKFGEDGTIQGYLEINKIPYTGSGVIGSSIGMDKDVCKRLVGSVDIPVVDSITLRKNEDIDINNIFNKLGNNLIVKIVNSGSSNGVLNANKKNLSDILKKLFKLSDKILIEKELNVREIEIGIIENSKKDLVFSEIGEVIKENNFYDYTSKYLESKSKIKILYDIDYKIRDKIINYSTKIYKVLNIRNYCRIDFFLTKDNKIFFNEINTLPGFQKESMFPMMFKSYSYINIINKIITKNL